MIAVHVQKTMHEYRKEKQTYLYSDIFSALTQTRLKACIEPAYLQKKEKLTNSKTHPIK